jgi:hypothetical protein
VSHIAVVVQDTVRAAVLAVIGCAAAGFQASAPTTADELRQMAELKLVVADQAALPSVVRAIDPASGVRLVVLWDQPDQALLAHAAANPAIVALISARSGLPDAWELMYAARRALVPTEKAPHGVHLLPWGSSTISWQPRSTAELRRIVTQIEGIARNLGLHRREAATVSASAHELLMNAMYDAPVDARGAPVYAQQRQSAITLAEAEAPTLRFAVGPAHVVLDAVDPFGRLPRQRYFDAIVRGLHNMREGAPAALDTSHGGAGLGLHTLFHSGCMLRAEVRPHHSTLVSWMLRRGLAPGDRASDARSLYFFAVG